MRRLFLFLQGGHQIAEAKDINEGKVCSSGTIIRQGSISPLKAVYPATEYRQVGYFSENWVNFLNTKSWREITEEEFLILNNHE